MAKIRFSLILTVLTAILSAVTQVFQAKDEIPPPK